MISVRGLRKDYPGGTCALARIDLRIEEGEFVALIGPSGAGKSTFLRCLNGLAIPTAGEIIIDGERMSGASVRRQRELRACIGVVFQQFNLLRRQSVLENVLVGRLAHVSPWRSLVGHFPRADIARAQRALHRVGLSGLSERRADTLSGGQQQRVAIARALVQEPRVLLADEPMASLDPALSQTIMELLTRINQEDRITVITSLHVLDLALRYGRRIIGLRGGRVVYDGGPEGVSPMVAERIFGEEAR